MIKKLFILSYLLLVSNFITAKDSLKVNIHGYFEGYYFIEPNKGRKEIREFFLYNHNRANAPAVNLAMLKATAQKGFMKSTFAIQTGTYTKDNYTNNQYPFRWINEASISFLFKKKNAQLDIGILPSYIGFETVFGNENITLSRSLLAENSPYYMSGVKFTFNPTSKLTLGAMISNGWQRIARVPQNPYPAIGSIVAYKKNKQLFQWNTFIGSEYPAAQNRIRFFNNFYWAASLSKKFYLIIGLDIGIEKSKTQQINYWYSPAILTQFKPFKNISIAARIERYYDASNVIVITSSNLPFILNSASVNVDYSMFLNILLRIEYRSFFSKELILKNSQSSNQYLGSALIAYF